MRALQLLVLLAAGELLTPAARRPAGVLLVSILFGDQISFYLHSQKILDCAVE